MFLGIDFGTCTSSACVCDAQNNLHAVCLNEQADGVVADAVGITEIINENCYMPTAVYVRGGEGRRDLLVGWKAKQAFLSTPFERGRYIDNDLFKLEINKTESSRLISSGDPDNNPECYPLSDAVGAVLEHIRRCAEAQWNNGRQFDEAVITIPAAFKHNQRVINTMTAAARKAGFDFGCCRVEYALEPKAAAVFVDHILQNNISDETHTLVYDLGGGTFDPALVTSSPNGGYDVADYSCGNDIALLGGCSFDNELYNCFYEWCEEHNLIGQARIREALQLRSREQYVIGDYLEIAKRHLSTFDSFREKEPILQELYFEITRDTFDKRIIDIINQTIEICDSLVNDKLKRGWLDLDRILLVGGSAKIPLVRARLEKRVNEVFVTHGINGTVPIYCANIAEIARYFDPRFAVCSGAALLAADNYLCRTKEAETSSIITKAADGSVRRRIPLVRCPNPRCLQELPDGASICPSCHYPLIASESQKYCHFCSGVLGREYKYCIFCGKKCSDIV